MTLVEFIRWSRDIVVRHPDTANYRLFLMDGEGDAVSVGDLAISRENEEIYLMHVEEEDGEPDDPG